MKKRISLLVLVLTLCLSGINVQAAEEGAAEGRHDNWGEVVTRQPYRKVRLDHLLSKEKEEVGVVLLSSCQGVHAMDRDRKQRPCLHGKLLSVKSHHKANGRARGDAKHCRECGRTAHGRIVATSFWWRCAQGRHPFSSRTRWLRPKRPMVLCWRRHGRAGGCQNPLKITGVERSRIIYKTGFTSDQRVEENSVF